MCPPGMSLHFAWARYIYRGAADTADPLLGMASEAERAAVELADAGVKAIMFGSTGGSFFAGPSYPQELADRLQTVSGVPCATTSIAVVAALKALGARTVSLVTPYVEMDNEREREMLLANGLDVVNIAGMQIHDGGAIKEVPLETTHAFARQNFDPTADVLFISCTNLRSAQLIATLEQEFGRPVITSNQAALWHLMQMAGHPVPVKGFGRLLSGS